MKKISVTVLSLIFFNNTSWGVGSVFRGYSVRARASKYLQSGKNRKKAMTKSLLELEERLWGESFGDVSGSDMKELAGSGFDPLDIISEMGRYRRNLAQNMNMMHNNGRLTQASKERVFEIIVQHHINTPVVLRWWDRDDFRNYIFLRVLKSDLTGNPKLLLRWWEEARVRDDMGLILFNQYIESSFRGVGKKIESDFSFDIAKAMALDPFLKTVLKAMGENEFFSDDMEPVIEMAFRRVRNSHPWNSLPMGYEPEYGI